MSDGVQPTPAMQTRTGADATTVERPQSTPAAVTGASPVELFPYLHTQWHWLSQQSVMAFCCDAHSSCIYIAGESTRVESHSNGEREVERRHERRTGVCLTSTLLSCCALYVFIQALRIAFR